jgi:hypothetical protein
VPVPPVPVPPAGATRAGTTVPVPPVLPVRLRRPFRGSAACPPPFAGASSAASAFARRARAAAGSCRRCAARRCPARPCSRRYPSWSCSWCGDCPSPRPNNRARSKDQDRPELSRGSHHSRNRLQPLVSLDALEPRGFVMRSERVIARCSLALALHGSDVTVASGRSWSVVSAGLS